MEGDDLVEPRVVSPEHQSLNVSCLGMACVSVWSWSALQFALQDLKIALANTPSVHPLFALYCIVSYKSVCARVCVCVCSRRCLVVQPVDNVRSM